MVAQHSWVFLEYCVWPEQCTVPLAWLQFTIIVPLTEIHPDPARIPFCGDLGLSFFRKAVLLRRKLYATEVYS